MSIHSHIAMYLLILFAVTSGCGTSPQPNAGTETLAAARNAAPNEKIAFEEPAVREAPEENLAQEKAAKEKEAAQEKAAANSYVKVKVEVELRGVLACTDEAVTVSIVKPIDTDRFEVVKWVLDFGEEKDMRAKAKQLDGKTVLVKGSAILRGIESRTGYRRGGPNESAFAPLLERNKGKPPTTTSVLDLEPKVAVKSLVVASKE